MRIDNVMWLFLRRKIAVFLDAENPRIIQRKIELFS